MGIETSRLAGPEGAAVQNDMPSTSTQTLYDVLNVTANATTDEINRAYKKLAKLHHPDRHINKPEAEKAAAAEQFKIVSEAAEILLDAEKRRQYDMYGTVKSSGDDAVAQDMFEQMFGVPDQPKGVLGGAMFYDATHKCFFQRRSHDVEALRREMTEASQGTVVTFDGDEYEASMTLPSGTTWEARLVEVDKDAVTVTISFVADDKSAEPAEGAGKSPLRCSRTLSLPPDADMDTLAHDMIAVQPGRVALRVANTRQAVSPSTPLELVFDGNGNAPSTTKGDEAYTPRVHMPRARRSTKGKAKSSGMRAGFLNGTTRKGKPRRVDFEDSLSQISVDAMEIDELTEKSERPLDVAGWASLDARQ